MPVRSQAVSTYQHRLIAATNVLRTWGVSSVGRPPGMGYAYHVAPSAGQIAFDGAPLSVILSRGTDEAPSWAQAAPSLP